MFTFTISTRVSASAGSWDWAGRAAFGSNCEAGFGLLPPELQEARKIATAHNRM
jgi:hypothetical protein